MNIQFIDGFIAATVAYICILCLLLWYFIPSNGWAYFILVDMIVTSIAVTLWQSDFAWPLQRVYSATTGGLGLLHGIGLGILMQAHRASEFVWILYILAAMYIGFGIWLGWSRPKRGFLPSVASSKSRPVLPK